MKPVMQTKFGYPEGNCFMACVASITGIPLKDLPNLYEEADQKDIYWWGVFKTAMIKLGWFPIYWANTDEHQIFPQGLAIAGGPSPRKIEDEDGNNVGHCVVINNGFFWHDPHPNKDWLLDDKVEDWTILIPLVPKEEE